MKKNQIQQKNVPYHLGIIMDGNRRWAKERGKTTYQGHKAGYDKLVDVGRWAIEAGVKVVTVYAFSTENWQRSKKEVGYLMNLLKRGVTKELKRFKADGIKLRVIGKRSELSQDLQAAIKRAEAETKDLTAGTLNIAINYGGRLDIIEAAKKLVRQKKSLTIENMNKAHWLADCPDPDLIIRTSGEQRLSGFMTWQAAYSEFIFLKNHWPSFTQKDFNYCVNSYCKRHRRFGGN